MQKCCYSLLYFLLFFSSIFIVFVLFNSSILNLTFRLLSTVFTTLSEIWPKEFNQRGINSIEKYLAKTKKREMRKRKSELMLCIRISYINGQNISSNSSYENWLIIIIIKIISISINVLLSQTLLVFRKNQIKLRKR